MDSSSIQEVEKALNTIHNDSVRRVLLHVYAAQDSSDAPPLFLDPYYFPAFPLSFPLQEEAYQGEEEARPLQATCL